MVQRSLAASRARSRPFGPLGYSPILMNEALAQTQAALELVLRVSFPLLAVALAVALLSALVALWTRLAEPAIGALARALVTLLVLGSSSSYMADQLVGYAAGVFRALPELAR